MELAAWRGANCQGSKSSLAEKETSECLFFQGELNESNLLMSDNISFLRNQLLDTHTRMLHEFN